MVSVGSAARTVFHRLPPRGPDACPPKPIATLRRPRRLIGRRRAPAVSDPLPAVSFVLGGGVPSKLASIEAGVTDPLERKVSTVHVSWSPCIIILYYLVQPSVILKRICSTG
jgi:hypothetical protein